MSSNIEELQKTVDEGFSEIINFENSSRGIFELFNCNLTFRENFCLISLSEKVQETRNASRRHKFLIS